MHHYQEELLFPNPQAQDSKKIHHQRKLVLNTVCFSLVCWAEPTPRLWARSSADLGIDPALLTLRTRTLSPSQGPWGTLVPTQWGRNLSSGTQALSGHSPLMTYPPGQYPKRPWTELELLDFPLLFNSQNTSVLSSVQDRMPEGQGEKQIGRTCARMLIRLAIQGDRIMSHLCVHSISRPLYIPISSPLFSSVPTNDPVLRFSC